MNPTPDPPENPRTLTTSPENKDNDPRPNPTTPLNWSSYAGSIQDIFSHNATKHPDRICVTETASPTAGERQFTYRQISEAANVLAWHLVESGVGR